MKPTYLDFDESKYQWKSDIDYRQNPHLYKIGKGQQGVLICQPYKSEICPHWKFKTPQIAKVSAEKIYSLFLSYLDNDDFVGADLAKSIYIWGLLVAVDMLIISQERNIKIKMVNGQS